MLTARQRERRINGIGSSDAPSILGLNPWRGPADIQAVKLGLVQETDDFPSEAAEIGACLEDGIATLAARRLKLKLVKAKAMYVADDGILFANVDRHVGEARKGAPIVEIKRTNRVDDYGPAELGADGLPPDVLTQVQHQLLVTGAELCYVVVYLTVDRRDEIRVYVVNRLAEIDQLGAFLREWWSSHVVGRKPIEGQTPTLDTLKRFRRVEGASVPVAKDIVTAWCDARVIRLDAEKAEKAALQTLVAALGEAEAGVCEVGTFSYRLQQRAAYTVEASSFRVPSFKAAKAAK